MSEITVSNPREGNVPEGGNKMSTNHEQPKITKESAGLQFEGTDVRHVLVNGVPMDVNESTYEMYRNTGAIIKEIGHSGPLGETPTKEFDNTTLPQAVGEGHLTTSSIPVTETPPAHDTLEPKDRSKRNLFVKLGLAASAVALAAIIAPRIGSDDAPKNPGDREPTASSGVEAGTNNVVKTPEQKIRDEMFYSTNASDVVDPEFAQLIAEQGGGYDPSLLEKNVDQEAAAVVAQTFLTNITVAEETGNPDALLAAFSQTAPGNGEFGENQTDVDIIKTTHDNIEKNIEEYPSYPIGSLQLESITEIMPTGDPDKFGIRMLVDNTSYGNYSEERGGAVAFNSIEDWYVEFSRNDVEGWSDGGSRKAWTSDLHTITVTEEH